MKWQSETKVSHPVRMRLFRLGASDLLHTTHNKPPSPKMTVEERHDGNNNELGLTFYKEVDSPTGLSDTSPSPKTAARGSIRQIPQESPVTNSPKSPSTPYSNGVAHHGPPRTTMHPETQLRLPGTPASDSEGWSAVGKATVGGKSGKVIERLQSEIDQLKRGIRASEAKYDEAKTLYDTVIAERDELRASKDTLDSIRVTNESLLSRRDRKIEQLKDGLEEERSRRIAAETSERIAVEDASKRVQLVEAERRKAVDESKYFQNQYEVLQRSVGQLRTEYQAKTKKLSSTSASIAAEIQTDQQSLRRYEAGGEQLRANYERASQNSKDIAASFEAYKIAKDEELSEFATQARDNALKLAELQQQLEETCGQMRQVMSIKETFKGEFHE